MMAGHVKKEMVGVINRNFEYNNMNKNNPASQIHINISGSDHPGILAEVFESIEKLKWEVLDIKQFVFNGVLNLSLLLEGERFSSLNESLAKYAQKSGMNVNVVPWDGVVKTEEPYNHRSVVTLLATEIPGSAFMEITRTLSDLDINILRIEQLDYGDHHVLEMVIGSKQVFAGVDVLNALVRLKENFSVDVAVQDDTLFRRNKRLIVMDADMTFLQCEVIDELGRLAGVGDKMAEITRKVMHGDMDFTEGLRVRVGLLKGLPVEELEKFSEILPLTSGAEDLVNILQRLGYKVAIVSGGFQFFIDRIKKKYGLDYGFANQLQIVDGKLTGELEGEIIDGAAKEKILVDLVKREGFSLNQTVAVGDGANDIQMLARAGLGIAFNAKPIVQKHAQASINISNLELILYFLGIDGKDLHELRELNKKESFPNIRAVN
jgi:phosphoserine phosphatase